MARKTQVLTGIFEFVVDIDNNRDDPDPFYVELEPMTARELEAYERQVAAFDRGRAQNTVKKIQDIRDEMLSKKIKGVYNYTLAIPSKGQELTPISGPELVKVLKEAPPVEQDTILGSIEQALCNHSKLEEGLRKKS